MRTAFVGVILFAAGVGVGLVAPRFWPSPLPDGVESRWEATLYLPAPVSGHPHLNDDAYKAALAEFTRPFGGATLLSPVEGLWHGEDGKLQSEAVRPVVVSFQAALLPEFKERLTALRHRLNQEALYIRYERPLVELYTR